MEYQLYRNSQQTGPYSGDQVQQMVDSGMISPQDLCWREGLPQWVSLADELGLAPPPPNLPKFAGFWLRLVAFAIDYTALMVLLFAILALFIAGNGSEPKEIEKAIRALTLLLPWAYYAGMESSKFQATLGKLALGLRVTNMSGDRISFGRATGRYFGKIVSSLLLGVGFIMAGFTQKKQALHDEMASCLVVRK